MRLLINTAGVRRHGWVSNLHVWCFGCNTNFARSYSFGPEIHVDTRVVLTLIFKSLIDYCRCCKIHRSRLSQFCRSLKISIFPHAPERGYSARPHTANSWGKKLRDAEQDKDLYCISGVFFSDLRDVAEVYQDSHDQATTHSSTPQVASALVRWGFRRRDTVAAILTKLAQNTWNMGRSPSDF